MRTDYLNPALYNKLYNAMTYDNVLALRVSLETGLRIDDVLSLKHDQLVGRTLRGVAEKTGKPYRKVISQELANRLAKNGDKRGFIFPHRTKRGEHRTRQAVWQNMKKAARLYGVELNAAPHSARKTYGVEVFRDNGLEAASRELQHDRLSTTMLYAFSDIMTGGSVSRACASSAEIDELAELIAEKVVKKLHQ